jgi:ubiquinone/menaquinone biosynthesis C-methylase UbiE
MDGLPAELVTGFCGVGNPFSLGDVRSGNQVLDIGCGAGFDLAVAGRLAGPGGRVRGIDLTVEMVERATRNLAAVGLTNAEVRQVEGEEIPYGEATFDLVISNGVINLSPAKEKLFAESHRVLKPGGRLQFADIVLEAELPPELAASPEAWSQ